MTLAQLLVVQSHDSAIDRLLHRRENLPEFAALAMMDDERRHLETERAAVAAQRSEIDRSQKRLEDDASLITDRHNLETERLYNGTVTGHKELQAIQDELTVLEGRRGGLEDEILELMELGEPLDLTLERLDGQLADVASRGDAAMASIVASQAEIDLELATERQLRIEAAEPVSAALLAEYETTRAQCGGVGVARLVEKTCEGCHLQLSAVAFDRARKESPDTMIRCAECNRILVR